MADPEDLKLGRTAVAFGMISSQQLASCLRYQSECLRQGKKVTLSSCMLHSNYITAQQLGIMEKQSFGRYKLVHEIGRGGMGKVYKAYDPGLDRTMALKVLMAGQMASKEIIARFLREAKATAKLDHPNIVKVYDIGEEQGHHYFAMDLIEGDSLQGLLEKSSLTVSQSVAFMIKIAKAVDCAHQEGIIHRDLKPGNVMIDKNKEPKVMDFGLAKANFDDKKLSKSGMVIGTIQYMSPEQAAGLVKQVDVRSDVYGLGAIFYELLTGRPPFIGNNFSQIMTQVIEREPPPLREIKAKIPESLQNICLKALEKKQQRRYQTASKLAKDLERFSQGQVVEARSISTWRQVGKTIKKHKKAFFGVFLVGIAVLALLIGTWLLKLQQQRKISREISQKLIKIQKFIKTTPDAKSFSKQYKISTSRISLYQRQKQRKLIKDYSKVLAELKRLRVLAPKNRKIQKYLYQIAREIGLLALDARNYLLCELSFELCRGLGYQKKVDELFLLLQTKRKQEKQQQLKRIDAIMTAVEQKPPEYGIRSEYITEIIQKQGEYVLESLVSYLKKENQWQRQIAIEALGKLKNSHTKIENKDIVEWLLEHLQKLSMSQNLEETEDLVWALGRLRDSRAAKLVQQVRIKAGESFMVRTEIPGSWLSTTKQPRQKPQNKIKDSSNKDFKKLFEVALKRAKEGDLKGALVAYTEVLQINPKFYPAYNNRANLYIGLKKHALALADFTAAIKINSNVFNAFNGRGKLLVDIGQPQKAIADLKKSISLNPNYLATYINLTAAYINTGKYDKGLKICNQIINKSPETSQAYVHRGFIYSKTDHHQKAIVEYNKAISLKPKERTYIKRALSFRKLKKYSQALADIKKVLQANPKSVDALNSLGLLHMDTKGYKKALVTYNRAIKINPRIAIVYNNRGDLYRKLGKGTKALQDYNIAIKLAPKNAQFYADRGVLFLNAKKLNLAMKDFSFALKLNKKCIDANLYRGEIYRRQNNYQKALVDLRQVLKLNPKHPKLYVTLGLIYVDQKKYQKAIQNYNKAFALDPKEYLAVYNRGNTYRLTKKFDLAIVDYTKTIEISPQFFLAYLYRGICYASKKQWSSAIENYTRGIQIKPKVAEVYRLRGAAYREQNKPLLAVGDFRKCLSLSPDNTYAKFMKKYIKKYQ